MSEFARTLSDLAQLCGKSQYQVAELSGLDPTFVRRLFNGEKRTSHVTNIRLTIALVMDPKLAREHPDRVPFVLNALTEAQRQNPPALK
jgi:transcriptional regulator with XRE-family HTH domain